jgi:hypothetical protein
VSLGAAENTSIISCLRSSSTTLALLTLLSYRGAPGLLLVLPLLLLLVSLLS